jgi:hypothetical protein
MVYSLKLLRPWIPAFAGMTMLFPEKKKPAGFRAAGLCPEDRIA